MPSQIDMDKIIADNPSIDLEEFRKGEEILIILHRSGAVQRSTYGLDTPESTKEIRHREEADSLEGTSAFRRLR